MHTQKSKQNKRKDKPKPKAEAQKSKSEQNKHKVKFSPAFFQKAAGSRGGALAGQGQSPCGARGRAPQRSSTTNKFQQSSMRADKQGEG